MIKVTICMLKEGLVVIFASLMPSCKGALFELYSPPDLCGVLGLGESTGTALCEPVF